MSLLVSPTGRRTATGGRRGTDDAGGSAELSPAQASSSRVSRMVPSWWAETGLVLGLYLAYVLTRGMQSANAVEADRTGRAILHWEQRWHLAVEAPLNAGLHAVPPLAVLFGYFYATLHFLITPAVLVFLYRRHPGTYRQARTALGLATATALIGYFLLPTAPPRLLVGGGFEDSLASVSSWGWWGGEGSAPRGLGGLTNQLAAMPSLHVGWALWSGWCLARYARRQWVRVLGAVYPVFTTLVVIATANHYLADALAGSLLVITAWAAVTGVVRVRALRRHDVEGATDRGATDRGATDRGATDRGATDSVADGPAAEAVDDAAEAQAPVPRPAPPVVPRRSTASRSRRSRYLRRRPRSWTPGVACPRRVEWDVRRHAKRPRSREVTACRSLSSRC